MVPAANSGHPRGGPDRHTARRDPTLSHILGGRPLGTPRATAVKIERILVGTDRSETATRAVKWAHDMARRYDAELIVLQAGGDQAELERYVQDNAPGARWRVDSDVDPAA